MATQDQDPGKERSTEIDDSDLPDRGRPSDDNEQAIEVRKDGNRTEVDVHQKSRRELRDEQRREERRRELEEHVGPLRQQLDETRRLLQEIRESSVRQGGVQQQPIQRQSQDDQDEYAKLSEEMEGIIADIRAQNAAGTLTPERSKSMKAKYYAAERKRGEILVKGQLANYSPPQGPSAHEQALATAHPAVWFNERARAHAASIATAEVNRREIKLGRGLTPAEVIELQHDALRQAGEDFRLTKPSVPAPTNGERARFSGTGATSRAPGGKITRQLQDHEIEAAKTMFPDDPESTAIEKFIRIASKDPSYFA